MYVLLAIDVIHLGNCIFFFYGVRMAFSLRALTLAHEKLASGP